MIAVDFLKASERCWHQLFSPESAPSAFYLEEQLFAHTHTHTFELEVCLAASVDLLASAAPTSRKSHIPEDSTSEHSKVSVSCEQTGGARPDRLPAIIAQTGSSAPSSTQAGNQPGDTQPFTSS